MRQHRWARTRARGMSQGSLQDRKSTRLNSSHGYISYAVFCLKKKKAADRTFKPVDNPYLFDCPRVVKRARLSKGLNREASVSCVIRATVPSTHVVVIHVVARR